MLDGLLACIVDKFVPHRREEVVTHALAYLARAYPVVGSVLADLADLEPGERDRLVYRPEAVDDQDGRPDIVGEGWGLRWVVVEGKLWAPLTDKQPCCYLNRAADGAVVVFVCPTSRVDRLRQVLAARVVAEGMGDGEFRLDIDSRWVTTTRGNKTLAVTTWPALLQRIREAGRGHMALNLDIDLVEGLVNRLESDLVQWSNQELQQGLTPEAVRAVTKGTATAGLAFSLLESGPFVHRAVKAVGRPKFDDAGGLYYRQTYTVADGKVHLDIGLAIGQWHARFPSPLAFNLDFPKGTDAVFQKRLHQAYKNLTHDLWSDAAHNAAPGLDFTPEEFAARWWWGPLPVAAGVSHQRTRELLAATLTRLLDILESVGSSPEDTAIPAVDREPNALIAAG